MTAQLISGDAGILGAELHGTNGAGAPLTLQPIGDSGE